MKSVAAFVSLALLGGAAICAQNLSSHSRINNSKNTNVTPQATRAETAPVGSNEVSMSVEKGAKWLASVQGTDGGWGQDGGDASNIRQNVPLESNGNDVANTAVAALALLRAGNQYAPNIQRATNFILQRIEASPTEGLSITNVNQTQIQRKLGPYIDTFLASMLLAEVDGTLAGADKARARKGLEKCVAKIEQNQMSDGSWNVAGGWAPVLGTSFASRSLYMANNNGIKVKQEAMDRAYSYTVNNQKDRSVVVAATPRAGTRGIVGGPHTKSESVAVSSGTAPSASLSAAAGVELYQDAQALEQLSRTAADRKKNANEIAAINAKLSSSRFVEGYGSIGGEEFFSYLNISEGLKRSGGKEWNEWYAKISQKILNLQNSDGTWAGHHCITGRVAVTSAAILNLTSNREK